MTITMELSVYDLWNELWSEGRKTLDYLTVDEAQTILYVLEEEYVYDNDYFSLTELNDFFAYETNTIAEWLGYENFDELMNTEREV